MGVSYGIYGSFGNESTPGATITVSDTAKVTGTGGKADAGTSQGVNFYSISITGGTLKGTGSEAKSNSCGVYARYGSVAVNGGTLEGTGGNVTTTGSSYGVFVQKNSLSVTNGTVTGTGSAATNQSYGVYVKGDFTIDNSTLTGKGGDLTNGSSYGLYAGYGSTFTVSNGSTINGTSGAGTGSYGVNLYQFTTATLSEDSKIIAKGGASATNSYGMFANGSTLTISGTITATGGENANNNSAGIYFFKCVATVNGSTITATGGTSTTYSYGIANSATNTAASTITVKKGGAINATAGTAATASNGINGTNLTVDVTDGTVTATGDTCGFNVASLTLEKGTIVGDSATTALSAEPTLPAEYFWKVAKADSLTSSSAEAYSYATHSTKAYTKITTEEETTTTTTTATDITTSRKPVYVTIITTTAEETTAEETTVPEETTLPEETSPTKDAALSDGESDERGEAGDSDANSSGAEGNPATGVALGMTGVIVCGAAAALASKKTNKKHAPRQR